MSLQLLLDTHALIWWWGNDERLPERLRTLLADDDTTVFVSSVSALEMAIKVRTGRLPEMARRVPEFDEGVREDGFHHLMMRHDHAAAGGLLPGDHKDPFDRVIAAQGLIEKLPIVTRDPAIVAFGCETLW